MDRAEKDVHHTVIEYLVYWQGQVNTTHLVNYFARTRQQVQKYIQSYQNRYPDNLIYDAAQKVFVPSEQFKPCCISEDVNEYLNWLSHHNEQTFIELSPALTDTSLSIPRRQTSPHVMRALVLAIKQKQRIDVDYVSLANPNGEGRIIQPHMFVKTGLRWHLRAFDEKHLQFRDFALSRFRGFPELIGKATHNGSHDHAWNEYIDLVFEPDARLTATQKQVMEQDYQMQNGQLIVHTRAALASYLIQEMQVNIKFHDEDPKAQQLVLVNKSDIKNWLFNA